MLRFRGRLLCNANCCATPRRTAADQHLSMRDAARVYLRELVEALAQFEQQDLYKIAQQPFEVNDAVFSILGQELGAL